MYDVVLYVVISSMQQVTEKNSFEGIAPKWNRENNNDTFIEDEDKPTELYLNQYLSQQANIVFF